MASEEDASTDVVEERELTVPGEDKKLDTKKDGEHESIMYDVLLHVTMVK